MESSNQSETLQAIPNKQINSVSKCFDSEEAMTAHYLQMADSFNANIQLEGRSDFARLKNLHRKLQQFIDALQPLTKHEWKRGVSEIQNACGAYMFQDQIKREELLHVNREIGQHLQFIAELAGNTCFIKQLYGNLSCHFLNVNYLIKKMKEQSEEAKV